MGSQSNAFFAVPQAAHATITPRESEDNVLAIVETGWI
jgi:hypothetical protein